MKRKIIEEDLKFSANYKKNLKLSTTKNLSITLTNIKTQLTTESLISQNTTHRKRNMTSNLQFPPNESFNIFTPEASRSRKVIQTPPSSQPKSASAKKIKGDLLTFNKRLRLFLTADNDETNAKFRRLRQKNVEELYFDYDKNNKHKKMEVFSGNNAGLLRNKVLFVKGVMDYMFPRILIKKMNFLSTQKNIKFENEMKEIKWQNSEYYVERIKSAKNAAIMSKYAQGGAGCNESVKMKGGFFPKKKIMLGGRVVRKTIHKYDLI